MRFHDRLVVVSVLCAAALAACNNDAQKNSDGGYPDARIIDAALTDAPLPDVSILDDSAEVNDVQADAGDPELGEADASLPEDAQGLDGPSQSVVSLTPASASFQTMIGTPSSPVVFEIGYTGDVPSVELNGTGKDDFQVSFASRCARSAGGAAIQTCEIAVVYNPKVAPAVSSTATLTVGTGDTPATALLTGTTVDCGSGGVITAVSTDFGAVVVGSTSTALTFTIGNLGSVDLANLKITTSSSRFTLATDNCTGQKVAVGAQCTFTVQFTPAVDDVGVIQGQLKATSDTGACLTSLLVVTGTAIPLAKLSVTPKALDFGPLTVLQESQPLTLTVSNAGGVTTGALKVDKLGTAFAIKSDTCTGAKLTAEAASKTCTITVTYTPAAPPSEATGSITVTDVSGAAAAPVTTTLHGSSAP